MEQVKNSLVVVRLHCLSLVLQVGHLTSTEGRLSNVRAFLVQREILKNEYNLYQTVNVLLLSIIAVVDDMERVLQ